MKLRLENLTLILPDWPGLPAHSIIKRRLSGKIFPALPSTFDQITGDTLIALAANDPLACALGKRLDVEWPSFGEGDFAIVPQPEHQRLIVLGGDKRGLLSGLIYLLNRAEIEHTDTLTWTHDAIVEHSYLPHSFYWTWDHSTNWDLSASGQQELGCNNVYLKSADAYIRDYKALIDQCLQTCVGGIVIYGFCRDVHGGVAASQEVCTYAAERGIRILPGVGTSVYGGAYYASNHPADATEHPLTARNFVQSHPEAGRVSSKGERSPLFPCPSHPKTIAWLQDCAQWLFGTFAIGGVNLEHGDFEMCYCEQCVAARVGQTQPGYYSMMTLANRPFIEEALRLQPDAWVMYATYTGFVPESFATPFEATWDEFGFEEVEDLFPKEPWRMGCTRPEFALELPPESMVQWTLSRMVHIPQISLQSWLDDGSRRTFSDNAHWPHQLMPPTRRNVGFLHQGSQWIDAGTRQQAYFGRYTVQMSSIKEACLRAVEAGLTGVAVHGEVSDRCIPYALNYLAHAYFCYHPESSLRAFGRDALGPIMGSATAGEAFVALLALAEAGVCSDIEQNIIQDYVRTALAIPQSRTTMQHAARFWRWLQVAAVPQQWATAQVYMLNA